MVRSRRESHHSDRITDQKSVQRTSAIKSANKRHPDAQSITSPAVARAVSGRHFTRLPQVSFRTGPLKTSTSPGWSLETDRQKGEPWNNTNSNTFRLGAHNREAGLLLSPWS